MATGQQMGAFGAWRTTKEDCKLVVAIHIGYTHSGYAFSFKHDYRMDPSKVSLNASWDAGSMLLHSLKTLTCVLFDEKLEFHSFGFEAENNYAALQLDEEHQNWRFFKKFKMQLPVMKVRQSNNETYIIEDIIPIHPYVFHLL